MKKMKGVVAMEAAPYALYEDPRARFKHQSLMQDYQDLEKETVTTKEKLKTMKQKKLNLLDEVRFLRRRYKYLMKKQSLNAQPVQGIEQPQNSEKRIKKSIKERKHSGKEEEAAIWRPIQGFDLNKKERNHNGNEAILEKPARIYYLNKQRTNSGKEAAFRAIFDVNQKEMHYRGKEASMKNPTPIFDLNKISREEEELQADYEPLREELKKNSIRGASHEQHIDMKLSVCRNIGNGSNRAGKRKISWQDQVALRV